MYRLLSLFSDFQSLFLKVLSFILLYFTPIKNYVHLVLILIAIDLITGSYASYKAGERFSARKLRNTIEKFIFYAIAIMSAHLLQQIINDGSDLARIVALYCGAIETKSIYENISRITRTDIVGMLWEFIRQKLDEFVQGLKSKRSS